MKGLVVGVLLGACCVLSRGHVAAAPPGPRSVASMPGGAANVNRRGGGRMSPMGSQLDRDASNPLLGDRLYQKTMQDIEDMNQIARSLSGVKQQLESTLPPQGMCRLKIQARCDKTQEGDKLLVMGTGEGFGNWQPDGAMQLTTDVLTYPVWSGEVDLPQHTSFEFKYAILRADGSCTEWEVLAAGKNRKLNTFGNIALLLDTDWGENHSPVHVHQLTPALTDVTPTTSRTYTSPRLEESPPRTYTPPSRATSPPAGALTPSRAESPAPPPRTYVSPRAASRATSPARVPSPPPKAPSPPPPPPPKAPSPPREPSPPRAISPPRTESPPTLTEPPVPEPARAYSPPRAASPARAHSPPRAASPTRAYSPPRAASPTVRAYSPPRAASPTRAYTPPIAMAQADMALIATETNPNTLAMPPGEKRATVCFRVKCPTKPGEVVGVVGGQQEFGGWQPEKALMLSTTEADFPYWSGKATVALKDLGECLRYKYIVKAAHGTRWEDAIADRTIGTDGKQGLLAPDKATFVDDGDFNKLQRVCTYVRNIAPGGMKGAQASSGFQVPDGMELVSMEQIKQWQARTSELEEEVVNIQLRICEKEAETGTIESQLGEEYEERDEMKDQLEMVQKVIERMQKIEEQVTDLEQTKTVLIQRSESMTDLELAEQLKDVQSEHGGVVDSINSGIAGAERLMKSLQEKAGIRD